MRWSLIVIHPLVLSVLIAGQAQGELSSPGGEESLVGRLDTETASEPDLPRSSTLTGSLAGAVISKSGGRLPGATITITDSSTGRAHQIISGEMGVFRISRLDEGKYTVSAELVGFEPVTVSDLLIRPGESQSVVLNLEQAFTIEDQVTVIGAASRYSLESTEIRESPSHDIGEALAQRAGIWRVRKGGIANDVVLRGFQGRDLNVLIDGQRIYGACPNNMDPAAFHVDFAEVERVDFSKGPFDIKNEGGLGGTVNIITRRPNPGWNFNGNLGLGSFGFVNPSAYGTYSDDRFSVLGGYSFRRSDPYSDGKGRKFTELTNYRPDSIDRDAFQVGTFWTRVGVAVSRDHYLQVSYAGQRADDVLYPYLKMDAIYDDTERFGVRWDARNQGDVFTDFSAQAYYSQVSHWMTDAFRTSAMGARGYSMGTLAATRALGGRFEAGVLRNWRLGLEVYDRFWGAATEMAGMNYKPQYSIPDVSMRSAGLYAEYLRPLTDALSLTGGVRVDRVDSSADESRANTDLYHAYHGTRSTSAIDSFASGNLKLQYRSPDGLGLAIGAGSSVQVPDPTERYFALKRMGSDWVGNPQLLPSRNNGIEGTIFVEKSGFFIQSDLFVNWVDDFVNLQDQPKVNLTPGVMNSVARSYENVDARIAGAEVMLTFPLHERIFLSGDLSYVRGTKTPDPALGHQSGNLSEIPPLRTRTALRYDDGRFFGSVEGVLSAAQRETDRDLGEEETPSYAIMNLSAGARQGRLSFSAGLGNLFDRNYAEHLSYQRDPFRSGVRVTEPGRNLFMNLTVNF